MSARRREHGRRKWQNPYPQAPCAFCYVPKIQSLLFVCLGFILHSILNSTWKYYIGVPSCNDPSTRELLWFLEQNQLSNPTTTPPHTFQTHTSVTPFGKFKQKDGILNKKAADVFGQGISAWLQQDLQRVYKSFELLGIDPTSTTSNASSRLKVDPNYVTAINTMRFRHDNENANNNPWIASKKSSGSTATSSNSISTSSALDVMVQHTNVIARRLDNLNVILTQLVRNQQKQKHRNGNNNIYNNNNNNNKKPSVQNTQLHAGSGITTPDQFTNVVNDLAIVITWVNGSDPITRKRRTKRCYSHYGTGARHCGKSDWRLDRVRETGELLYALRAIEQNMPWFQGLIYLVVSGTNFPIYLKKKNPRLIVVPQSEIVRSLKKLNSSDFSN
jgi:hypothetical protein